MQVRSYIPIDSHLIWLGWVLKVFIVLMVIMMPVVHGPHVILSKPIAEGPSKSMLNGLGLRRPQSEAA